MSKEEKSDQNSKKLKWEPKKSVMRIAEDAYKPSENKERNAKQRG